MNVLAAAIGPAGEGLAVRATDLDLPLGIEATAPARDVLLDVRPEHLHLFDPAEAGATARTRPPTRSPVSQSQLTAGHAPDVVQLGFSGLDFAVNELPAAPLDDLVGKDTVAANFDGETHPYADTSPTLGDWESKTYGAPFLFPTPMLYDDKPGRGWTMPKPVNRPRSPHTPRRRRPDR